MLQIVFLCGCFYVDVCDIVRHPEVLKLQLMTCIAFKCIFLYLLLCFYNVIFKCLKF